MRHFFVVSIRSPPQSHASTVFVSVLGPCAFRVYWNVVYKDIELTPGYNEETEVQKKERELEGVKKTQDEDIFTILEVHTDIDLEGFEDKDSQGEPTGIKLPYVVTIEMGSREILSIRRNFQAEDPTKSKIDYFVHFKFLPGMGFYGFGLIHMIGGLSRTATQALRQLLDAGTLSNLPAGFKQRGIRVRDEAQAIQPGEFRDVDAPGGSIKDAFMPLPFKEPSPTLLQLMGTVVSAGQSWSCPVLREALSGPESTPSTLRTK